MHKKKKEYAEDTGSNWSSKTAEIAGCAANNNKN